MFEIILYKNKAERNRVDKSTYIEKYAEIKGTLRESTSILTPVITIQFTHRDVDVVDSNSEWVICNNDKVIITLEEVLSCNYLYIPMFKRYYFIKDIVSVRNGLWQISMSVDVLMSFKDIIYEQTALIGRNESIYDLKLKDSKIPCRDNWNTVVIPNIPTYSFYTEYRHEDELIGNRWDFNLSRIGCFAINVVSCKRPEIEAGIIYNPCVTASSVTYIMNYSAFLDFIERALSPTYEKSNQNKYLNISDCINYIKILPFTIETLNVIGGGRRITDDYTMYGPSLTELSGNNLSKVYVGGYPLYSEDDNVDYKIYQVTPNAKFKFAIECPLMSIGNSFLNQEPYTRFEVFIPFNGFIDVNINLLNSGFNIFNFILDPNTFNCECFLSNDFSWENNSPKPTNSYVFNFFVDYGIGRTNQNQIHLNNDVRALNRVLDVTSVGKQAVSTIGSFASNPTGAINPQAIGNLANTLISATEIPIKNSIEEIVGNQPQISKASTPGSIIYNYMALLPYGLLTVIDYEIPTNYEKLFGRPLMQTYKIGDLINTGLTVIQSIRFNCDGIITIDEENVITLSLQNGVIL